MPRFQLLVRELGKEPRVVPLGDPIVIGRSRNADLPVDDEEVGRKQFRIGVTSGFVVLEGLGATNPTRVDETLLPAGQKTTVPTGSTIRCGKTSFVVESADKTESLPPGPVDAVPAGTMVAPRPGAAGGPIAGGPDQGGGKPPGPDAVPEGTMIAPGPGKAGAGPAPGPAAPAKGPASGAEATPPSDDGTGTGGFTGPMNTMEMYRPGAMTPASPPSKPPAASTPAAKTPAADTPAAKSSAAKPPKATGDDSEDFGQTMAKGFRPGAAAPAATPSRRQPPAAPPPAKPPAAAAAAPPAPPAPPAAPAAPAAPAPGKNAADGQQRPKTVAVRPEDLPPPATALGGGDDLESRLHQSMPRVFVKSEGLKRRVRLMKASNRIGRAETADVLLPHESVSELHAEARFDGNSWTLRDCGSTNGTVVDGKLLRGNELPLSRNTLIGIGALQIVFLFSDPAHAARDRREEERALKQLMRTGRVTKQEAAQIRQLTRGDATQSIAEILLMDTTLSPTEWANAIAIARAKAPLLDRILKLIGRR